MLGRERERGSVEEWLGTKKARLRKNRKHSVLDTGFEFRLRVWTAGGNQCPKFEQRVAVCIRGL